MIKLYEIIRGIKQPLFTFYDLDDSQIRSDDSVTEGFFITAAELEQREREAFASGRALISKREWPKTLEYLHETFDDYLKRRGVRE